MADVTVYDLTTQGIAFKRDFNQYERVKKVFEDRGDERYFKIDLVSDESGALFLIRRTADFKEKIATLEKEAIPFFTRGETFDDSEDTTVVDRLLAKRVEQSKRDNTDKGLIYFIGLDDSKEVNSMFDRYYGGGIHIIRLQSRENLKLLHDADFIFFAGGEKSVEYYARDIEHCGNKRTVKVALSDGRLEELCDTRLHVKGDLAFNLDELVNRIQLDSLVPLDMDDAKTFFKSNPVCTLQTLHLNKDVIRDVADSIIERSKEYTHCCVIVNCGKECSLDDLQSVMEPLEERMKQVMYSLNVKEYENDEITLTLLLGQHEQQEVHIGKTWDSIKQEGMKRKMAGKTTKEVAREVIARFGVDEVVPVSRFFKMMEEYGIIQKEAFQILWDLKVEGLVYAPKEDHIQRME